MRWVYRQCEPSPDIKRLNFYDLFWLWFRAIWRANQPGAEILFEDFRARVQNLRLSSFDLCRSDWYAELARCEVEQSEALRAAIRNQDLPEIKKEISEAIAAYRGLLSIVEARGTCLGPERAALSPPAAVRSISARAR